MNHDDVVLTVKGTVYIIIYFCTCMVLKLAIMVLCMYLLIHLPLYIAFTSKVKLS